jgi:hypothetical protein
MKRNARVFVAVALLALAALACQLPGLGGSNVLLSDDFSSVQWGTGTDPDSSVEYVSDSLNFFLVRDLYFVWSTPNAETYQNVHIEVTASNNSTDSTGAFGIICNMQVTDVSYYFAITGAGEYAIGKSALAQDDVFLTNNDQWEFSDAITAGAPSYRIGADCGNNGTLSLYVDGAQIASVVDTTYTSGNVALFAWSGEEPSGTNVSFDDFVMTELTAP